MAVRKAKTRAKRTTGQFVEIQGTAEREPFSRAQLNSLLDLGTAGCAELTRRQQVALNTEAPGA